MEKRKNTLRVLNTCRFCLSRGLIDITTLFEKNKSSKDSNFTECLEVLVFPSDRRPRYICSRCKFFIDMFYDFKNICCEAGGVLEKYIESGSSIQPICWPKHLLALHNLSSREEPTEKTIEGGATVQVSSQDTSDSTEEDGNINNIKIGEGNDDEKTTQIKDITNNNQGENSKTSLKDNISRFPKAPGEKELNEGCCVCDVCDRTYPLQQLLDLHKQQKHRVRNVECDQCDALSTWIYHNKVVRSVRQLFYHSRSYLLTTHQLKHIRPNNQSYVCDLCDKT